MVRFSNALVRRQSIRTGGGGAKRNASFGVGLENDELTPYVRAVSPPTVFDDSPLFQSLSGEAHWEGTLVGFTTGAKQPMGAVVDITVQLSELTGRIDYIGLQTIERDGTLKDFTADLRHDMAVRGNTFVKTGGDAGTTTAVFAGERHETIAGTVRHPSFVGGFSAEYDDENDGPIAVPALPTPPHAIDRISQSADALLVSDLLLSTDLLDVRLHADCSGTTCALSALGQSLDLSLTDVVDDDSPGDWPPAAETRRGVSLVSDAGIGAIGDSIGAAEAYGGWLDHNFFLVAHATVRNDDLGTVEVPFSMSIGDATGSNPLRGTATWSGVMVGVDASATESRFNSIRGDADLTIADFADPKLDVAFTNIRDVDAGRPRADMAWDDVPMTNGGFETGSDGNSVQGKFHGPNHEEVGGIFERDQVIGAFGAKRP